MLNIQRIVVALLFVFVTSISFAQSDEVWYKLSPELRLDLERPGLEFRYRPVEKTLPYDRFRTDFMAGKVFGNFKVFSWTKLQTGIGEEGKFDIKPVKQLWTGLRLDYNFKALNKKLLGNLQYRYFWRLNDDSRNQHYWIQFIYYNLHKYVDAGLLGFGRIERDHKRTETREQDMYRLPFWYMGPMVKCNFSKKMNLIVGYCPDVFGDYNALAFFRLNYRIKAMRKKTEE